MAQSHNLTKTIFNFSGRTKTIRVWPVRWIVSYIKPFAKSQSERSSRNSSRDFGVRMRPKSINFSSILSYHKQSVHKDHRPFACDQCSKTYTRLSDVNTHKKLVHRVIRSYVCDQCDESYQGIRAHTCGQYGKHFASSKSLYQHKTVNSHHINW